MIRRNLYLIWYKIIKLFLVIKENNQLRAIEQSPWNMIFIKNPTPKVMRKAIEKQPAVIKYIKNPSTELQLLALKYSKSLYVIFSYMEAPSAEIFIKIIETYQQNSWTRFQIIKKLSKANDDVIINLIKHDLNNIYYIKYPSQKVLEVYNSLTIMQKACE